MIRLLFGACALLLALSAFAGGGGGGGKSGGLTEEQAAALGEGNIYVKLNAPIIVNYGSDKALRYVKADVAVRVKDLPAAQAIEAHMPLIRNNLLLLIAAETDDSLGTFEGKEDLRKRSLASVQAVVAAEAHIEAEGVIDLYFSNFLIQQ